MHTLVGHSGRPMGKARPIISDLKSAAATIGVEIDVVRAVDSREIEGAFTALARDKVHALVVGTDPFFYSQRVQLVTLAMRHALPTVYNVREYAEAGGLMSYGTSLTEALRQMSAYTARILKGEKPINLPVVLSTKFNFVINLPTARTLGLAIPPMLLARADGALAHDSGLQQTSCRRAVSAPTTASIPARPRRERQRRPVKRPTRARSWCGASPGCSDVSPSADLEHQPGGLMPGCYPAFW
jgi:hypothetical protein